MLDRRSLLGLVGLLAPSCFPWGTLAAADTSKLRCGGVTKPREQFLALPGDKSFAVQVEGSSWRDEHLPDTPLFVGSAFKTFVLATYLQQVEAGRLSESEPLAINDDIRSLTSSVFGSNADAAKNLKGEVSARTALEAMIAHSDNTATDAVLRRVGVGPVRSFIASAGLTATMIPDSTRVSFSYMAGSAPGVDEGWAGMLRIMEDQFFGTPRSAINDRETMVSTAGELVSYYRRAMAGAFFKKPETLTEYKRVLAMADMIAQVVPPDVAAYAKGGSIDWQNFHAFCAPGQMIVGRRPVTFCFTVNWSGPDDGVPTVFAGFREAVAGMLRAVATCLR